MYVELLEPLEGTLFGNSFALPVGFPMKTYNPEHFSSPTRMFLASQWFQGLELSKELYEFSRTDLAMAKEFYITYFPGHIWILFPKSVCHRPRTFDGKLNV